MSRRALILAVSLLAPTATAAAQTSAPRFTASVSPQKASKKKPRSVSLSLGFDIPQADRKTPVRITVRLPADVRLSGAGFPTCPSEAIVTGGEGSCPAGSRVGSAVVTGMLSTSPLTQVSWTARVYVASADALAISFKGLRPAVVDAPIRSHGRRLRLDVPPGLRAPSPGLSTYVNGVSLDLGGTFSARRASKPKTYRLATLDGCPADRTHDLAAEIAYARNDAGSGGSATRLATTVRCRR